MVRWPHKLEQLPEPSALKRRPCQELLQAQVSSSFSGSGKVLRRTWNPAVRAQGVLHSWGPQEPCFPACRVLSQGGSLLAGVHPALTPSAGQACPFNLRGGQFSEAALSCPAMPVPMPRSFDWSQPAYLSHLPKSPGQEASLCCPLSGPLALS